MAHRSRMCRAGTKYAGEYHYDDVLDEVKGCPARAPCVKDLLKIIRVRSNQTGAAATQKHAEAMKVEDLETIMNWSESQHPIEAVELARSDSDLGMPTDLATPLKHVMMRAFLSSGFTLWTR